LTCVFPPFKYIKHPLKLFIREIISIQWFWRWLLFYSG